MTEVALALEPRLVPPGEILYREGEMGDTMYFLTKGQVVLSILLISNARQKVGY